MCILTTVEPLMARYVEVLSKNILRRGCGLVRMTQKIASATLSSGSGQVSKIPTPMKTRWSLRCAMRCAQVRSILARRLGLLNHHFAHFQSYILVKICPHKPLFEASAIHLRTGIAFPAKTQLAWNRRFTCVFCLLLKFCLIFLSTVTASSRLIDPVPWVTLIEGLCETDHLLL